MPGTRMLATSSSWENMISAQSANANRGAFRRNGSISRKAQKFVDNRNIPKMQAGAHFRLLRKIQTFPRNQTRKPSAFHGTRYVSHQMSTLCPSPPFRKLWRYPPHLENLWEDGAFPRNKGVEISQLLSVEKDELPAKTRISRPLRIVGETWAEESALCGTDVRSRCFLRRKRDGDRLVQEPKI
jgi:hypothetical protein